MTSETGDVIRCQNCGSQSRSISRGCSQCGHGVPVANLADIPHAAVEAAHDQTFGGVQANRYHIRMMLAAALPYLNTAKANEDFAGFYMTNDDGYPALTYYPNEDDDGVHVRSADAGTSLAELIGAARKLAASLRGKQ